MNSLDAARRRRLAVALVALWLGGCDDPPSHLVQGYVEGEFVYVAPPVSRDLESLHVRRGDQVAAGDLLFTIKSTPEETAKNQAEGQLAQTRALLDDATKGLRPTEIDALEAKLKEARASLSLAEGELARLQRLRKSGAVTDEQLDRARSDYEQKSQLVAQYAAELETGLLGDRVDRINAARAEVQAREAALASAEWDLDQTRQSAPQAGLVFDTLYRVGEWVAAGRPVVSLLPPNNIKVRAFVPEPRIATVEVGEDVHVYVDGRPEPLVGTVTFISPRAEYTPPVIYSRESRSKLVFLVELRFDPDVAATLHPGQPVDVEFE
ncbi:MAG: HlyD family efflux transporter periplasmic adaptor subunit [Planctomycetaceae bacterium]